jgi:hypothetical protein
MIFFCTFLNESAIFLLGFALLNPIYVVYFLRRRQHYIEKNQVGIRRPLSNRTQTACIRKTARS